MTSDVIVIGGGTAGMTAALYIRRAGKTVTLFEGGDIGGQIVSAHRVENYPSRKSVTGAEFAGELLDQILGLGAEIELARVEKITPLSGGGFAVSAGGKDFTAAAAIVASGVVPRSLGLAGEKELTGKGVSYCATCDGALYKNRPVAVAGGGNTAAAEALYLSSLCSDVYLVHRRDSFRAETALIDELRARKNVHFVLNAVIEGLEGQGRLEGLRVRAEGKASALRVEALFEAIGRVPDSAVYKDLVDTNEQGYIIAGEDCRTSREGIFAAGDCRVKEVRQLTTATADGSVAATAACRYADRVRAKRPG